MTRVAIIGSGAMGSLFAAHFADAGAEVWAFDGWREHIEAMRRDGLRIRATCGERKVALRATSDAREPGICDIALVMVKFRQTRETVAAALPMIGKQTLLVTLQNGIGNVEAIRAAAPDNRILFGLTTLTSEMLGPGSIEGELRQQRRNLSVALGWPRRCGLRSLGRPARCAAGRRGGRRISSCASGKSWWSIAATTRYARSRGIRWAELIARPEVLAAARRLTDEIVAAGQRNSIPLDRAEAVPLSPPGRRAEAGAHFPSMLIDVRQQAADRIECLNGAVLRECERHGIAAPLHAFIDMIRAVEASWRN